MSFAVGDVRVQMTAVERWWGRKTIRHIVAGGGVPKGWSAYASPGAARRDFAIRLAYGLLGIAHLLRQPDAPYGPAFDVHDHDLHRKRLSAPGL